ncbi:unnamed protein product [Linum trigynum]|uniref:Uncharacterized protein n=1 Tax=Linum trigynum TaxID=586398 RepID=A0AAV2DKJ6_9ROSI
MSDFRIRRKRGLAAAGRYEAEAGRRVTAPGFGEAVVVVVAVERKVDIEKEILRLSSALSVEMDAGPAKGWLPSQQQSITGDTYSVTGTI